AWYVAKKDFKKNQLIIVPSREHPLLYQKEAVIKDVNWTTSPSLSFARRGTLVEVAIRYRQKPERARLVGHKLFFDYPVWALAPGQSAVLYHGAECLGGGFIG
ncbi:MAG: tRNA 2-thiouridine(34) synthase MnmA, partial [Candidatus Uhrbacteria bacterium]|nr:tRNA 2-thiouridine(34) synthase MnmA [Candidatus Uhrbacteria bacterium]